MSDRNIAYTFNSNEGASKAKLNMEQRKNIYLIYKEALHNAVKYSSCSNIKIVFIQENSHINLSISDDGKGFDLLNPKDGNGLQNMRNRSEEIKADFKVCSDSNGTTIYVDCKLT
jgi:signal transduction histidine kinase